MNHNVEVAGAVPAFQGQRLLAFSKFLRRSSHEIETSVRGGSMGSALPEGSQVRIRLTGEFHIGKVVAYVAEDRIVAHRLVRLVPTHGDIYLITRGDASVFCDSPIRVSAAMGVVAGFRDREQWQAIAPKPRQRFAVRLIESALAASATVVLRASPTIAIWTGTRVVQIRWVMMNVARSIRSVALRSSNHS
jgi:hypothetical protein